MQTFEHEFMRRSRALAKAERIPLGAAMSKMVKEDPQLHADFLEQQRARAKHVHDRKRSLGMA